MRASLNKRNLHFNMLLLNRFTFFPLRHTPSLFTFQYASIKPVDAVDDIDTAGKFTFQYASIKPADLWAQLYPLDEFTFQYASIKPQLKYLMRAERLDLHFNMLLLNLNS